MASKKQLFVSAALCGLFSASLGLAQATGEAAPAATAPSTEPAPKMEEHKDHGGKHHEKHMKKEHKEKKMKKEHMMEGKCHGVNECGGKGDCGSKGKDGNACKGKNTCKGKGWNKMSKHECTEKGGKFKK